MKVKKVLDRLRQVMHAKDVSQNELSDRLRIDKGKTSRLLNGHHRLTLDVFLEICDALSVNAGSILDEVKQETKAERRSETDVSPLSESKKSVGQSPKPRGEVLPLNLSQIDQLNERVDKSLREYPGYSDTYHAVTCGVLEKYVKNRRKALLIPPIARRRKQC